MESDKNKERSSLDNLWVITRGRYIDLDLNGIYEGVQPGPVREYRISDLARYMLNPNPIEIEKKLVGCEVRYRRSCFEKINEKLRHILPEKLQRPQKQKIRATELLISDRDTKIFPLKDGNLESHFNKIHGLLRPYDPIFNRLSGLDMRQLTDVTGICEDIDGIRSVLNLRGSIDGKINYLINFIMKDVRVLLERAYIADGLFEMRGFDFSSFDPQNARRLIRFMQNGMNKSCVLSPDNKIEYWIDDVKLVHYMHLLKQAIKTNPKFGNSLDLCMRGNAKPLKILFSKQLEIDYSESFLPEMYKEVFEMYDIGADEKHAVMNSLKNLQLGISFNYIPQYNSGEGKMFTNISVMHDFRALEHIKDNLPLLYSEINKRTYVSEAGKFYLLDSIKGCRNE